MLLTCSSFISMTIAMFFRVYLSKKIGPEGIGLYQLIFSIFAFAATLSSSGNFLTITRLVTDFLAKKQDNNVKNVMRCCIVLGLFTSAIASIFMFFCADFIGTSVLRDRRAILSLKILAPVLPFTAVSSCFRGYFYAVRKIINTATDQIIEQVTCIIVFFILIDKFTSLGLEFSCAALAIGLVFGEIVACLYSYMMYVSDARPVRYSPPCKYHIFTKIFSVFLPATAVSSLGTAMMATENILIPTGLKKFGTSPEQSLFTYGMIIGMAFPIIAFPGVFLLSISALLIPEISHASALNSNQSISFMVESVFKATLIFSVMVTGICFFFSDDLSMMIYNTHVCGRYIHILSPLIPLIYLDKVVDGILKGLNQQIYNLWYNIIDFIVRLSIIVMLLPTLGIKGLIIMLFVSSILTSVLSISRLIMVSKVHFATVNLLIKPLFCILLPAYFFKNIFDIFGYSGVLNSLFRIALTVVFYFILLILTKCINPTMAIRLKNSITT